MSFTFDQKYLDFLKKHEEEYRKEGFREEEFNPTSVLAAYLDWMDDHALCNCGHGCRDAIADNGPKLTAITRAIRNGASLAELDAMCLEDPKKFARENFEAMWARAEARSRNKRETKG